MGMHNNRINHVWKRRWLRTLVCFALLLILGMDVSATALGGDIIADGNQVSVAIEWGELAFTYTEEYQLWNPATHAYDKEVSAGWNAEENWLTVENSGEGGIKAILSSTSNVSSVKGMFREDGSASAGTPDYTVELKAKESQKLWFELTGTITTSYENLGEIIITIIAQ